jgi:hypothetical protein
MARRLNINGSDVAVEAIAKRAGSLIRLFSNRHFPIIVVIDRENRNESARQMEERLTESIVGEGVARDQLVVAVCDRMIENWILADEVLLRERYGADVIVESEGCNGKRRLAEVVKAQHQYHETTVGVGLFCAASARRIRDRSDSFFRLSTSLRNMCEWIVR